jgi:hypothetical protein
MSNAMNRDQTPSAKPAQSWWVGTAMRQHILLKFIVTCLVIALLILGVVVAINS